MINSENLVTWRDTVTILSMSLEIWKTYIDYWKLNNNGFILYNNEQ